MKGRKIVLALAITCALSAVILGGLWVYAANVVWSTEVNVEVSDYTLSIVNPGDGTIFDTYTFTGTLNLNGASVSGKTVTLYVKPSGGSYTSTSLTAVTGSMGEWSITWTPSSPGNYTFKAKADI